LAGGAPEVPCSVVVLTGRFSWASRLQPINIAKPKIKMIKERRFENIKFPFFEHFFKAKFWKIQSAQIWSGLNNPRVN
jgi:hypothetical protein